MPNIQTTTSSHFISGYNITVEVTEQSDWVMCNHRRLNRTDDATPLNNVPELIDKIQVETATKARDDTFQKTLEVVGEWAIEQRHILKTEKVKQKEKKPNDISSQIMYGAKAKVFQQVIDKIKALGQLEKE